MNRRRFLGFVGGLSGSLVGCLARDPATSSTNTTSTSQSTTTTPTQPTCSSTPIEGRPTSSIYISEAQPNPENADVENLNDEYVFIEMWADTSKDLSGYELWYCQREVYHLPDLVSDVKPGEGIIIHSGDGEDTIDNSKSTAEEYRLYVGNDRPLLVNDGMQLALRASNGEFVDNVRYRNMDPGQVYVRPE